MPRIRPAEFMPPLSDDLDRAERIRMSIGAITAHRPQVAQGIGMANAAVNSTGTLSARLIELLRLRIAFHNQCRSCMAVRYTNAIEDGLDEALICSLEQPQEADDLTAGEKAALRFADLFATDHLAIDDVVYDDLRQHFTEGELVEIGLNCALNVGMGRLVATWNVTDDLPARFQTSDLVTPWGGDGVVTNSTDRRPPHDLPV